MLYLSDNIKKLVKDKSGFYFTFEDSKNSQIIYQSINETAFIILKEISYGIEEFSLIEKLQEIYIKDKNVEKKINSFIESLKKLNLLSSLKINKVKIIENNNIVTPRYCIIELSANCLLNCSHCYLGIKHNSYIDKSSLINIINELSEIGLDYIQLTGGEPLLYPDFKEILDYLIQKNLKISITTSGYLLKYEQDILKFIAKYRKNCFLQVSVDGLEKTHNLIRGKKDAFEKTINFIKQAISLNIEVHVATVIQKRNINDIEPLIRLLKESGVKRVRLSNLMEVDNFDKEKIVDYKIVDKITSDMSKKYKDDYFDILSSEDSLKLLENRKTSNCGCGSQMFTIDSDLNFYNCVLYRKPLFNLNNTSLKEGLLKYSYKNFKLEAPNLIDCNGCKKIDFCKGCITLGLIENEKKTCYWGKKCNL